MKSNLDRRIERACFSLLKRFDIKKEKGVGLFALAVHKALYVTGKEKYTGKPKDFIRENLSLIESYIRENPVKNKKSKKTVTKKYVSGVDVSSDGFLSTYQWRSLRMVALKKYGAVCMCCGDSPKNGAVMNVDHIKPRKLFPELALDINNLQILCSPCNHGKGNWDFTDWRNNLNEIYSIEQENANHIKSILLDL